MRIAAVADIHFASQTPDQIREFLDAVERDADLLAMGGDLTNFGRPEELDSLFEALSGRPGTQAPIVAVLGNHDFESGNQVEVAARLTAAGVHVLDGTTFEYEGIGIAGVKGFVGGYGRWVLAAFGEPELKRLVQASLAEAAKLERALAGLTAAKTMVLMHYSPIVDTLVGESPEIYPYLGTSRLADAIDHHGVDLVIHGHAHRGSPDGLTPGGVPVHNVALTVLKNIVPTPYRVFEL